MAKVENIDVLRQNAELDMAKAELENYKGWYFSTVRELERLREQNKILSKNADTAFQDGLNEAQELYAEEVKTKILEIVFDKCLQEADVVFGQKAVALESLGKIIKAMEGDT